MVASRRHYGIVSLGGAPTIALPPGPKSVRLAGAARIHGFTAKRAFFRRALRAIVATGLDRFAARSSESPLGEFADFDFGTWLRQVSRELGLGEVFATVIWPWPPGFYRGRLYVHLLNRSGLPLAFCKIALDPEQGEALNTEVGILEDIGTQELRHTRVPAVLSSNSSQGRRYLALEALPPSVVPAGNSLRDFPAEAVQEISGVLRKAGPDEVLGSPWWGRFLDRVRPAPSFTREMESRVVKHGAALCRVHGDFEPKNLMKEASLLWVLDWERGDLAGPRLTDRVGYFVSMRLRESIDRPSAVLSEMLRNEKFPRLDVGLALAFLAGVGSREATSLVGSWVGQR